MLEERRRWKRIRNEQIIDAAKFVKSEDEVREARLRWFTHVLWRDRRHMGQKGQAGEGAARKEEKRSFMDGVKEETETKSVK